MKEPILVILAAGMGSRYGGLKQIDTVGSNGESIIDFSIYDAIRAGFKRVALIIKKEHEKAFEDSLGSKIRSKVEVIYVYQDIEDLPTGFSVPKDRVKPWGTTHALLACRHQIDAPFMICNADDYYGVEAFKTMYDFLKNEASDELYSMIGYKLANTLTDHGTVTRGICKVNDGILKEVVEIQKIRKNNGVAECEIDNVYQAASEDTLASMNYWGFTPYIFKQCEELLVNFLNNNIDKDPMKCEHVIPTAISELLAKNSVNVKVFSSKDNWFGVTYKEDKPLVVEKLAECKEKGLYPFDLWK